MNRHFIHLSFAIGMLSFNGASAQLATGVTSREKMPIPAVIQTPGAQLPPPGGNPLWGIPMSVLTATRERPVFSATRRPPASPPAPMPIVETPPQPAEPEQPLVALVGTATGETENVAVVMDQTSKNLVRLHVGEAISGWFLRSVDARTMTLKKDSRSVTLALPAANSAPSIPAGISARRGTAAAT